MGIRDLFSRKVETADHSSLSDLVVATALQNGVTARADTLKVPAIYRAKTMTEKAVAAMPVASWTGTEKAPRQPVIVTNPTAGTREQFIEETVNSLMTGEAYWELLNYVNGFPTDIRVLNPEWMNVNWDSSMSVRQYRYRDRPLRPRGFQPNLAVISIDRGPGDLTGFGPMSSDRIDGIVAQLDYIQDFFEGGGNPTGIMKVSKPMTEDEAKKFKQYWLNQQTTRSPAILSQGFDWEDTSFSPSDSAWVEAYYSSLLDAANLFGVPPTLLGFNSPGSSLTYQNLSDVWESWYRGTLYPVYIRPIEAAWSRLVPRGQDVRFQHQQLTRLSADARSEFYTKALSAETGWLSREEVRELEGLAADGVSNQILDRETM